MEQHSEEYERDKYRRMWAEPRYRYTSPGEKTVKDFLSHAEWKPGETLIDLGCGKGGAGKLLADAGLDVTLLDFCSDAVEVTTLPFIDANLWDLPSIGPFDWIFCADVLEHIPPVHVDKTLDGMARITRKGGYLQIALQPDGCGALIGEKLHLTVESPAFWGTKIAQRWEIKQKQIHGGAYAYYWVGSPRENGYG